MRFMRIMIGVHGEEPWTKEQREQVHAAITKAVLGARRRGKLTPPEWAGTGQKIKEVDVNLSLFPPPTQGDDAYTQGFWRRENPFEKGTEAHDRWNAAYDREPRMRDYDRMFRPVGERRGRDDG